MSLSGFTLLLTLILIPSPLTQGQLYDDRPKIKWTGATITKYCLTKTKTTSGPKPQEVKGGCIALSRSLARDLGLYRGPGPYDYKFGAIIEVEGMGRYTFADLMPTRWKGYRVDVWNVDYRHCLNFGVKKKGVRVIR